MGCTLCGNKKNEYVDNKSVTFPPYNASDIYIADELIIRKMDKLDWENGHHKVLVYYNDLYSSLDNVKLLESKAADFEKLNVDLFICTTQSLVPIESRESKYMFLSSYILASRLGILVNGSPKQCNVYITKDGEVIKQEEFPVDKNPENIYSTIASFINQ